MSQASTPSILWCKRRSHQRPTASSNIVYRKSPYKSNGRPCQSSGHRHMACMNCTVWSRSVPCCMRYQASVSYSTGTYLSISQAFSPYSAVGLLKPPVPCRVIPYRTVGILNTTCIVPLALIKSQIIVITSSLCMFAQQLATLITTRPNHNKHRVTF